MNRHLPICPMSGSRLDAFRHVGEYAYRYNMFRYSNIVVSQIHTYTNYHEQWFFFRCVHCFISWCLWIYCNKSHWLIVWLHTLGSPGPGMCKGRSRTEHNRRSTTKLRQKKGNTVAIYETTIPACNTSEYIACRHLSLSKNRELFRWATLQFSTVHITIEQT